MSWEDAETVDRVKKSLHQFLSYKDDSLHQFYTKLS